MFVYHIAPKELRGTILYPLNQLAEHYPDLARKAMKKYEDRPRLLTKARIPTLECTFADTIFFSPIHPMAMREAFTATDLPVPSTVEWLAIPAAQLEPSRTTIWKYEKNNVEDPSDYDTFSLGGLEEYAEVPERTLTYYKGYFQRKQTLFYHGIPHILYRGNVDVKDALRIIA